MSKKAETLTLALCIALLPPLWAVAAPYAGVTTGAVALICAGLCAANGGKLSDAPRISAGFLLGDFWAWLALAVMELLPLSADLELFLTLFALGGLAVIISGIFPRWIYCPAWLCGWAIGLTVLSPVGWENLGTLPIQIGAAMLAGVWYVGVFLNLVRGRMLLLWAKRRPGGKEQTK